MSRPSDIVEAIRGRGLGTLALGQEVTMSYTDDELEEALEQYRRGELSFEEYKRMCDEADREEAEENYRRKAAKKRGGWQPFVSVVFTFDR